MIAQLKDILRFLERADHRATVKDVNNNLYNIRILDRMLMRRSDMRFGRFEWLNGPRTITWVDANGNRASKPTYSLVTNFAPVVGPSVAEPPGAWNVVPFVKPVAG